MTYFDPLFMVFHSSLPTLTLTTYSPFPNSHYHWPLPTAPSPLHTALSLLPHPTLQFSTLEYVLFTPHTPFFTLYYRSSFFILHSPLYTPHFPLPNPHIPLTTLHTPLRTPLNLYSLLYLTLPHDTKKVKRKLFFFKI